MASFTTNDGVTLTYEDSGGDGVPLLMLHGWSQTQAMFREQLAGLDRRVVTVDFRGHGVSEKPRFGYRIARLAQDAAQLLDHLGLEETDLLGWSMGASVSWSFLDQFGSGRVRKLILVDQPSAVAAVAWMSQEERDGSGAIFDVSGLVDLCAQLDGPEADAVGEGFVRSMFSGDTDPEVLGFVLEEVRTSPAHARVPLLFDHCAQDWRDVLPRIDVPTLVIGCEGSHVSPSSQEFIAGRIPGARIHVFGREEASSHFPFLENPPAFNAVVDGFLAG